MLNKQNINYYLIIAFIIILSISFNSFFKYINYFIYDKTVSLTLAKPLDKKPVLLVELSKEEIKYNSTKWKETLNNISKFNPKSFIFLTDVKFKEKDFNLISKKTAVYLSSKLKVSIKNKSFYEVSTYIKNSSKHIGFLAIPKAENGVYRYNFDYYDTDIGQVLALSSKITQEFQKENKILKGKYYINFNNQLTLPTISYKKLISSASINEIIKDKHIIFGYKESEFQVKLTIPSSNKITLSEFFTYSLLTQIKENEIIFIEDYLKIITILFFLLLGVLFHNFSKIEFTPFSMVGAIVSIYCLSWILLNYYLIWIPIVEISITIIITSYINIWYKQKQNSEKTNKLLIDAADKMKERVAHKTFFNSNDYWKYIANLITQTLNINKIIFLEKVEGDHRLHEIEAVNCDLTDIKELRRDYEREPFLSAIKNKTAIRLNQREFFKDVTQDEYQYMVPLIYSGQVMGFWAFTIDKDIFNSQNDFTDVLSQYSAEISTLLYQRYEWRSRSNSKKSFLKKIINLDTNFVFMKIQGTFTMLEKRLNMLETVINRYDNGVILYDMFGRVYHINKKMEKLLANVEVLAFKVTAEELIMKLCDLSMEESTHTVRSIILEKYHFTYKVKLNINKGNSYLLKASALSKEDLGDGFNDTFLFDNYGILIEIIDISLYKNQVELKNEVIEESNKNIKNILESITSKIKKDNKNQDKELLKQFDKFLFAYNKMEDIVSQDIFFGIEKYYPVNILTYIKKSINSFKEVAQESYIEFEIINKDISFAFINPLNFENTINGFINFLINDAIENSKITIYFEENKTDIIIFLKNKGFGLPNDKFNELLKDSKNDDKLIKNLKNSILDIKRINGDVKSISNHGIGITFEISLKKYQ